MLPSWTRNGPSRQAVVDAAHHLGEDVVGERRHQHAEHVGARRGQRPRIAGRARSRARRRRASIWRRSPSETRSGSRNARDTVIAPTPASCATSAMVGRPPPRRERGFIAPSPAGTPSRKCAPEPIPFLLRARRPLYRRPPCQRQPRLFVLGPVRAVPASRRRRNGELEDPGAVVRIRLAKACRSARCSRLSRSERASSKRIAR